MIRKRNRSAVVASVYSLVWLGIHARFVAGELKIRFGTDGVLILPVHGIRLSAAGAILNNKLSPNTIFKSTSRLSVRRCQCDCLAECSGYFLYMRLLEHGKMICLYVKDTN